MCIFFPCAKKETDRGSADVGLFGGWALASLDELLVPVISMWGT